MTATREQIVAAIRERIVAYASSRVGDFAEDLAQEALVVLETKYAHIESQDQLLPLAFQILRFKMSEYRRKAIRRGEFNPVPLDGLAGGQDHAAEYERRELKMRLLAAIRTMEGRCREIFRMKLQGRTYAEIQTALGANTINTIYTWDFRCRQQLLAKLNPPPEGRA